MAWFTISELLGEQYRDFNAFKVLCALRGTKQRLPRSFVPHGFEHLIRESGDIALSRAALGQLLEMTNDKSERVRYEAEVSLARVKGHFAVGTPFRDKSVLELVSQFRTSWSYDWKVEFAREIWREYGISRSFSDKYFSTVRWKTPCCEFAIDINFKFSERYPKRRAASWFARPEVSWLRSKWQELDGRIGIPCGECGARRRPDWRTLLKLARQGAREIPDFSKQSERPS